MANNSQIPIAQKGQPATMRSTAKVNEIITGINQLRSAQIRVAPGPSRMDVSGASVTITVGGDDIVRFLRSGGHID